MAKLEVRKVKHAALNLLRRAGVFEFVANSRWRRERLLILCYHGISLEDEHLWRPRLYMSAEMLEQRMEMLRSMRCSVLPLSEALALMQSNDLPPRSVAMTFDDGAFDFYKQACPLLKKYGLPATVYQTTYYTDHEMPIFNLICSYMLWKRRGERPGAAKNLGISEPMDLSTEQARHRIVRSLIELSEREKLTGSQKNELAKQLADVLGIDYALLTQRRILQLMNAKELAEVGRAAIDVQLHSHRHRTPNDEVTFRREIIENRERIRSLIGREANHFCYPSGVYREEFTGWLEKEKVISATTCDVGLAHRDDNRYLLPRFVDTFLCTPLEFESWLTGVGSLVAMHRAASQRYIPVEN